MKLSDLRMDTHHCGRILTLRRVVPVVKLVAYSWTIVKEEFSGDMERFEIMLHKSKHGQDILESGSIFQVMEPYFTLNDQGYPTLRIYHPSDFVVCTDSLHIGSPQSSTKEISDSEDTISTTAYITLTAKTAIEYKEEGNAALKQQDLLRAYASYTQGLKLVTMNGAAKEDLAYDLFRNRAHINLILSGLDEAKADALASLIGLEDQNYKELDSKAYVRAGRASYHLGEF
jgi:hypothetical protein